MADSLIDKVAAIEARADELLQRARAEVKELEEHTGRRLKELQGRYQAEVDRRRRELKEQAESTLRQAIEEEDRRFEHRRQQLGREADPQVEQLSEEVAGRFYQPGDGGDGH